jgi:hypothetical protein
LDDTVRTYRQLKSVRGQMKRCLKELHAKSNFRQIRDLEELEEVTRQLAETKTFLRKRFERLTKRRGPYRVS